MITLKESILADMEDTIINGDKISKRANFALDVKCNNFDDVVDTLSKFLGKKLKVSKPSSITIHMRNGDKGIKLTNVKVVKFDIMGEYHKAETFKFILDANRNNLICQYLTYYAYLDKALPNGEIQTLYRTSVDDCKVSYQWGTSLWDWLSDANRYKDSRNLLLRDALLNIN
jgi:hypothetical protein